MTDMFDQVAIVTDRPKKAIELLHALGADDWTVDRVITVGDVHGEMAHNEAVLSFNYQLLPCEFEVLHYTDGKNWLDGVSKPAMSHLGKHVDDLELVIEWAKHHGLPIMQHVRTAWHTNSHIKDRRRYEYLIVGTRDILGFDIKFIKRSYIFDEHPMADKVDGND